MRIKGDREARQRRHNRVRKKILSRSERPRLSVYRSLKNIYCQVIDDINNRTLIGASSLSPEIRQKFGQSRGDCNVSREVGKLLAIKAKEAGISKVVFDRGGYIYHGRIKALAEGAREGGLEF